jgi:3-dehydroquinate dehydratase-2
MTDGPRGGDLGGAKGIGILVLHGPTLNLLGEREPAWYGTVTLEEVNRRVEAHAEGLGINVLCRQSNIEGELVTEVQQAREWADGLVINAAGYSHTSVAIRDAIAAAGIPAVAVHLSNTLAREEFRKVDLVAEVCVGVVAGLGWLSYTLALEALANLVRDERRPLS